MYANQQVGRMHRLGVTQRSEERVLWRLQLSLRAQFLQALAEIRAANPDMPEKDILAETKMLALKRTASEVEAGLL